MTKLEKLFNLAEKEGIEIYYKDLKILGFLGLYIECYESPSMILLDDSLKNNDEKAYKILLEELGHHYTSCGDSISCVDTYLDKLKISKCEIKAERWLCHYLISTSDLIDAINKHPTSVEDICDYLNVDIEMLLSKLKFLSLETKSLHLGTDRFVSLTNLPNMFIYDMSII
ncbi:ImmA/IrrE family metallo-endopeptidase [Paraclostridium bifermentans]|uniref:ImmA/IrrE family metallo-endopeptidase n=1 Tax=Paraclostridium bifermentans TaxID=1490 RepID=UPI00387ABD4F